MRYTVLLLSVMNTTINLTAAATTATTHYYCLPLSTTFYFSCLKLNTQPTQNHIIMCTSSSRIIVMIAVVSKWF